MPIVSSTLAGLAGGAWLNAKIQFGYDCTLIRSKVGGQIYVSTEEKRDRLNLFYTLERHATAEGTANRLFLMYNGKQWTYKEVYDIVMKYGTWLKTQYAVAPNEVVAMDFMNSQHFVFLCLGIWSIGAKAAFINYNLTEDPLLHSVKNSTARVLFVDEEVRHQFTQKVTATLASPKARDGKGPVETVYFDKALEQQVMETKGQRESDESRAGAKRTDMALLIFTSGIQALRSQQS